MSLQSKSSLLLLCNPRPVTSRLWASAVVRMFPPQPTISSGVTYRWMKSVETLPPCNLGSLETVAGETPVFALGQAPSNPLPRVEKGGSFGSQHQSRCSVRLSCQLGTPYCALDPDGASTVSSPKQFGPRQLKIWFSGSWRPVGVPASLRSSPRARATLRRPGGGGHSGRDGSV